MGRLTDREKMRLHEIARAHLLARPSHPTKIEFVEVTVEVLFRDGNVIQVVHGAWK